MTVKHSGTCPARLSQSVWECTCGAGPAILPDDDGQYITCPYCGQRSDEVTGKFIVHGPPCIPVPKE